MKTVADSGNTIESQESASQFSAAQALADARIMMIDDEPLTWKFYRFIWRLKATRAL